MKIMMVITGMHSGGAERVMATLCNELVKTHSVQLLVLKDAASDYQLDEKVELVGGNVSNQNVVASIRVVKKQIEQWKPDVVLSFMTKTNIIALCAKLVTKTKAPFIIAERANPYNAKKIFRIIRKYLYPLADGCVFQTRQAQDYYKNILKAESVVLRNPLNPDFKVEAYTGPHKKKIVTVGRLSVEKNQKLLIEAFARIAAKYPEHYVEIYGDGPLRAELENQIREEGMENRVFLMGRKNHIHEHIQDAELFVLPSNSEGMPNALLEAMALGLPSVATDCPIGGSAVIVDNDKNGVLIPMNDPQALAQAMDRVLSDDAFSEKLRTNAVKVLDDFETAKVCGLWEQYLKKVAAKH